MVTTSADRSGGEHGATPTDAHSGMSTVMHRNIRALTEVRLHEEAMKSLSDRVADRVTGFAGSMTFVLVHAVWFGGWLIANMNWIPGVKPWDPFPFVMLAMIASVEAIFLSTFILISQNRMQQLADRRAELDVQIGLLTEHELTRAIQMLDGIAKRLDAPRPPEPELEEIKRDVSPEKVIDEIQKAEEDMEKRGRK